MITMVSEKLRVIGEPKSNILQEQHLHRKQLAQEMTQQPTQ